MGQRRGEGGVTDGRQGPITGNDRGREKAIAKRRRVDRLSRPNEQATILLAVVGRMVGFVVVVVLRAASVVLMFRFGNGERLDRKPTGVCMLVMPAATQNRVSRQ